MPQEVKLARQELFSCNPGQFHPDGKFSTTIFTQEPGTSERITEKRAGLTEEWSEKLGKPTSGTLKPEVVVEKPKAGDYT